MNFVTRSLEKLCEFERTGIPTKHISHEMYRDMYIEKHTVTLYIADTMYFAGSGETLGSACKEVARQIKREFE